MNKVEFLEKWSTLHGGAKVSGVVKGWLSISYAVCKGLNKAKVTPNALSYISLLLGVGFVYAIDSHWAILFLVLSLAADGLDGTLAIISNRVTKWGAALDSIMDRLVEALWAYGLFLLGAPVEMVVLAWLAAYIQEYMRARAGGLGINKIGVVTASERPVRASFIFIALVARLFEFNLVVEISTTWAVLQVLSALTVLNFLRPLLRQSPR